MIALNDKTVVLAGSFGLLMQNLVARLTETGADVVVATDDTAAAQRVCQNFMDMREVSEKYGRASAIELEITDAKSAENTFSRAAEIFGGVDIYVDTQFFSLNIPYFMNPKLSSFDESFNSTFEKVKLLSKSACDFLKSRNRARILYIINELDIWSADKMNSDVFNSLKEYVREVSLNIIGQHTTINALAIGPNEEYLLSRFGRSLTIQKSLKEVAKDVPHARLVDFVDITNTVNFMISPLSSAISGQVLRVDLGL